MTKDELADVRAAVLAALVEYESMKKNKRTEAVKKAMRSTIAATALGGAGFSLAHSDRESTRSLYEEHRIGVDLGTPQDAAPVAAAAEQKVKQSEQKQAAEEAKRSKQALAEAARQEKASEAARKKQVEEEARAEKVAEAERKKQAAEQARSQMAAEEQQRKLAADQAREQHVAELAQRKLAAEQLRAQKAAEEQQHKLAAEQARKEQLAQLEQRKQAAQQAQADKAAEEQRLKVAAEQARKDHLAEVAQHKQAEADARREQVAEAARRKQALAEARQERLVEAARLKQAALEAKKLAAAEAARVVTAPAAAVAVAATSSTDQAHGQMADAMHREQTIKGAVHFGFGSRNLAMAHKERLDSLVQQLPAGAELTVIGHTDSRGNRNYNYVLGKNRALAVAQYLTEKGVSIKLVGSKGENSGSSGWMARRVDIVLAYNAPEAIQVNLPPVLEHHAAKQRVDASKVASLNDGGRVASKHRHRSAVDRHAHLGHALKRNRHSEIAQAGQLGYSGERVAVGGGFEESTGGQPSQGLDEKLRVSDGNLAKMRPGSEGVNARGAGAGDND